MVALASRQRRQIEQPPPAYRSDEPDGDLHAGYLVQPVKRLHPLALLSIASLTAVCGVVARAQNPIVVGQGLTDPKVRIYGDRAYLYATHDASPTARNFLMNDWWTWSSDDLVHWKYESTLKPEQTYWGRPCDQCWATDAISRNGKYYFYFSRGNSELGVVEGPTPTGPWFDPLHKPLVAKGSVPTAARDPAILQEKDGTTYLVFGCWDYYIAKLNDDMISLAQTPRRLELDRKMGPYGPGKTDDKSYLHEYNGKYYLSWGCFYAMADNVYGPYTYKGCIITSERTAPEFQKKLVFDRHASVFELHHQWYFICNDQSWPGTTPHYRDSVISYLHYRDNGESAEGVSQTQCPEGGFELSGIRDGSYVEFPNTSNVPADATIRFRVAPLHGGTIEIHSSSINGPMLGTCLIRASDSSSEYETLSTSLKNEPGKQDIYLVFRAPAPDPFRLNWFSFQAHANSSTQP
jgi:arabinoxylan arabinofuranohydrolase